MVFIVDDSQALRERLVSMFAEIEGVEVLGQARNVAEALEGVRALRPGVVILDIQMPGGSGIDVLREIKQAADPPVVLMLTNHAFPQYRRKCMELGADYFLDKTRDFHRLPEIFRQLSERLGRAKMPEELSQ
jgi:DNA-binding NarL/FixJ family response regulator